MIVNFGGNVVFQPQTLLTPHSENEVLQILKENAGRKIRTVGRLHSWSRAAQSDDVLLDLRHLDRVQTEQRGDQVWASIGAGCQIKRVLVELQQQASVTLPSVGLITEQTIAGAISTGTHGSGKHSLSHYVVELRIASYDPTTGEPVIRIITAGDELRAARCSLGCLGVILSVGMWTRPRYLVEEHFHRYSTLDEVLAAEREYPLQQFFLMPWLWDFIVQHRREAKTPRTWVALVYRLYFWLTFDIGMHLILLTLVQWLRTRSGVTFFYRRVLPRTAIHDWKVVDHSYDMLVMDHERFRHIEIEIFVKRSKLPATISFIRELLRHFHGEPNTWSATNEASLKAIGMFDVLASFSGTYTHHYPICVRRVQPDDTMISMASSDDEDYYAISFISYARRSERESFLGFAKLLARTTSELFQARPHWGKVFPIDADTVANLYPHLADFRRICNDSDPSGRFRNDWVNHVLALDEPGSKSQSDL